MLATSIIEVGQFLQNIFCQPKETLQDALLLYVLKCKKLFLTKPCHHSKKQPVRYQKCGKLCLRLKVKRIPMN